VEREAASCGRQADESWRVVKAPVPQAMWDSTDISVHGKILRELPTFRSRIRAATSLCPFKPSFCSSWQIHHALY